MATVTTSSISRMESGAVGRRGNKAGRHVGEAGIVNLTATITRMKKSDNRAEARERALGRERIAMGAADSVAQRTKRRRIGAVAAINGAVNQELNGLKCILDKLFSLYLKYSGQLMLKNQ